MRIFSKAAVAGLPTSRIAAFSDGVFSIAITLLVLNLQVPTALKSDLSDLPSKVLSLWPNLISYMLSFIIIGIYWIAHHNMFHYIKRANRTMLWINNLFLMCIAFIPFPAALIGRYPEQQISIWVYGGSLIITNVMLNCLWLYATNNHRLVDKDIDPHFVKAVTRRNLLGPTAYLISIGLSFLSTTTSLIVFILVPLFYILPTHIDLHLTPTSHSEGEEHEGHRHVDNRDHHTTRSKQEDEAVSSAE